jgi:hypothetical protein
MQCQYSICVNIYYGCASHAASVLWTRQCPEQRHGTAQQMPKAERQQAEEKHEGSQRHARSSVAQSPPVDRDARRLAPALSGGMLSTSGETRHQKPSRTQSDHRGDKAGGQSSGRAAAGSVATVRSSRGPTSEDRWIRHEKNK